MLRAASRARAREKWALWTLPPTSTAIVHIKLDTRFKQRLGVGSCKEAISPCLSHITSFLEYSKCNRAA
jgi:hypothetical protein